MNGFEIITSRSIDNTIDISSLPIKCSVFIPNCSSCYSK